MKYTVQQDGIFINFINETNEGGFLIPTSFFITDGKIDYCKIKQFKDNLEEQR